jgi:sugar phosphate isomerase/epimerase
MKDVAVTLDGRRGWNFRSLGHGDVDFDAIVRELNDAGYTGPLSVEWEDSGMDREVDAREALQFVRGVDFAPSSLAFDASMKGR